jgi:hypothetical protein
VPAHYIPAITTTGGAVPTDTKEDLRASALRQLNEEWANSIAEGHQLARVFGRLLESQQKCHSFGLHTSVVFEDELTQRAWNEFRRMSGDMVPDATEIDPPRMEHEQAIFDRVMEEVPHGNTE